MVTLAQVMEQMATQIRTALASETDVDIQVEGKIVPAPSEICVDMYPSDPSDDQSFAGFGDVYGAELIAIRIRIPTTAIDESQEILLGMIDDIDALSIAAALDADPTLNGYASSLQVKSRSGIRDFQDYDGRVVWIGCLLGVTLIKARS